ncbi:hypothetical protein FRC03_001064 [Tulasnella sp. 419]|nr:hypothetical protein FRC03_001064 [Tulasnella sp. 419]
MSPSSEKPPNNADIEQSNSSVDEKADLKDSASISSKSHVDVAYEKGVDVTVTLFAGHAEDADVDPVVSKRLRWKLDLHIIPLLVLLYTLQFIDKQSLAASSILGIIEDNRLTTNQYNNLSSAFYIGYILFVYPHVWMMQRFPAGKWLAVNIFLWAVFMGLHCVCHNYGGLFALRFLLGASEGCVTTGVMNVVAMFYTRTEIGERLGWTFMCNGIASVISGFIAFGVAHVGVHSNPARWEWFMIIMCIYSFITSVLFFFLFPDNPATAWFLSSEEKVIAVQRIRANQAGIEAKVWKREQFIEALTDAKTWVYFFFAAIANLQGGVGVQYSIIIRSFGFTTLETTLLNIPGGATMVIAIILGGLWLHYFDKGNQRAWIGIAGFLPAVLSCLLLMCLPWSNKPGMLAALYLMQWSGLGFITVLHWVTVTVAGHTKKMTVNAIFLIGYSLGQTLSTQFWKQKYRPRNYLPFGITLASYTLDIFFILLIRWMLDRENKRRDREKELSGKEYEEFGYVEKVKEDGTIEKLKVPIQLLDVTDKQNPAFRYVL